MGAKYTFKICMPTSSRELETVRRFVIYPYYTVGFAAYGSATIIGTSSTKTINGNIIYSSGSVNCDSSIYAINSMSKINSISGSFLISTAFVSYGVANPTNIDWEIILP